VLRLTIAQGEEDFDCKMALEKAAWLPLALIGACRSANVLTAD